MSWHRIPRIDDYDAIIGAESVDRIRSKADKLKGLRVVNFNSTYYGGGVAEILSSLTLLMNSLGLRTEWRVIQGTIYFASCNAMFVVAGVRCKADAPPRR